MWLFTKYGFFSAVCARQGDGSYGQPVDRDRMMVRARCREHLEALMARSPDELGGCEVRVTEHTDYRYRLFVEKDAWRRVLDALASEMDYDNFKEAVARHAGVGEYGRSLHKVWEVMHAFQHEGR